MAGGSILIASIASNHSAGSAILIAPVNCTHCTQALEWLVIYPELVQRGVVIACGAASTAWQIGIAETQRQVRILESSPLNPCAR